MNAHDDGPTRPDASWQLEPGALPGNGSWDVVVVGGGPAGSTCARHLARGGHRVLLAERRRFPRDKACGDLLIPDSLAALRRAGLLERVRRLGRPLDRATVSSPSRIEWPVRGDFVTLERRVLDATLAAGAAEGGAVVVRGAATTVEPSTRRKSGDGLGVRVAFREGFQVRARVAVLATGADVSLLEPLGMLRRKAPTAVAVRGYLAAPGGPDHLLISFDRSIVPGYGWIFPLPGGRFNVGVGVLFRTDSDERIDLKGLLDHFLASYPPARALRAAADGVADVRGARLRCGFEGARAWAGAPVVAIGETLGTTYPFTGEGMGKAMESGELAAELVARALDTDRAAPLAEFESLLAERFAPRYRGYQVAQDWFSHPWMNDVLSWRASRSRHLQRKADEMVAETSDPREAFSLGGLLRSFWR